MNHLAASLRELIEEKVTYLSESGELCGILTYRSRIPCPLAQQ